ncbi:hypothetical protein CDL15_Pgr007482 [Punica granatum]|uniref:Pathogen-related protein-like n=1 Tax=Punica granatum TaxID=22663 RepID=A0A218X957_PUNGR|nr:hypothetical protein CDL15_Pgr007482 [Punica granatum]
MKNYYKLSILKGEMDYGEETEGVTRVAADKYRSILNEETENTQWRHGGPPIFNAVNKLFEEVKSWEMELSHKTRLQDFKTINPEKFKLIVNVYRKDSDTSIASLVFMRSDIYSGGEGLSGEETLKLGSYNALLKSSLPEEFKYYKADEETFESSHHEFRSAFPRGFAWEVIAVYSGPPVVTYKFRHWGYFEGPFKGHRPTGEMAQFYGVGIMKVDESMRAEDVEIYYDPAELFGGLLKGPLLCDDSPKEEGKSTETAKASSGCPFSKST